MKKTIMWVIGPQEKRERFIGLLSSKVKIVEFDNFNSERFPIIWVKNQGYEINQEIEFEIPDFIFYFPKTDNKLPHESHFDKIDFIIKSELFKKTIFQAVTPVPRIQAILNNIGVKPMSFNEIVSVVEGL